MYAPPQAPMHQERDGTVVTILITFIVGLFTFFPYIISLVLSVNILKRGYLRDSGHRTIGMFLFLFLINCIC